MAPQRDLYKVGADAFDLLEYYKPKNPKKPPPIDNKNRKKESEAIDCNEAAKAYGGLVYTEYPAKKVGKRANNNNQRSN